MAFDEVEVPLENQTPLAGGNDTNFIAGLEAGLSEGLHGNRRLMLRADPSEAPPPFLYFPHGK